MANISPAIIQWAGNQQTEGDNFFNIDSNDDGFDSLSVDTPDNDYIFYEETTLYKNTLRFHAIISEDHKAKSQITKFPIQNGFEISNHAIKKNRVITLEGVISNVVLEHTDQANYNTGTSNTINTVYTAMKDLVTNSIPCVVTTNLGVYDPVVFTDIQTKQEVGFTDSIKVIIKGEELQLASNIAKTGVKELVFSRATGAQRAAAIERLRESGIDVPSDSVISEAEAPCGESFKLTTALTSGDPFSVSYIAEAYDGISEYTYGVFTGNTDVYTVIDDVTAAIGETVNIPLIPSAIDLMGGLDGVTNCLFDRITDDIVDEVQDKIDTFMGEVDQTIYGAQQDIIKLGKDSFQKTLIGTALDCVAVGVSDAVGSGNSQNVEDVIDEVLLGIKGVGKIGTSAIPKVGDAIKNANIQDRYMTFTKVQPAEPAPLSSRGVENAPST